MTLGQLGHLLVTLSFFSSCLGVYASVRFHSSLKEGEGYFWSRFLKLFYFLHAFSLFSALILLWYLLFTQRFEYHYVWSHSARGLPTYYLIAALWEGQEGSFLLWLCWHALLMPLLLIFHREKWQKAFLFLFLVQAILSSMLLGVYIPAWTVPLLCLFWVLLYEYFHTRKISKGGFLLSAFCLVIAFLFQFQGNGFFNLYPSLGYLLLFLLVSIACYLLYKQRWTLQNGIYFLIALVLLVVAGYSEGTTWKIGSSPFLLLKEAMPDAPIFQQQPDFIPSDGNGLNPLLQNYWMVIHPPTLFLGYALATFPFALMMSSLLEGQFRHLVSTLMPWLSLTVLFLGGGIIMGGYWAYETLSFGGYWNWDPVENASFVPWLFAVASIHALLTYQKRKLYLKLALILTAFTFLFVLYSTFLTRSGILGDTSVHSFTDLGLSGQLIFLLLCLLVITLFLFLYRWKSLPQDPEISLTPSDATLWLIFAVFLFLFLGMEIITVTSLPVFNSLFNTNLAPPTHIQRFYYYWTAPFAILIPVFALFGVFLYWFRYSFVQLLRVLLASLILSGVATLGFSYYFTLEGISFAYDVPDETLAQLSIPESLAFLLQNSLDDILLFCSFYNVFGTFIFLWLFIKKYKKKILLLGGSLSHFGFALILIGAIFSSGYDRVVTSTANPAELGNLFSEEEKKEYLLLPKGEPRYTSYYRFTYFGKKKPSFPLLKESIQISSYQENFVRIDFKDSENERYYFFVSQDLFESILENYKGGNKNQRNEKDFLAHFIEQNYPFLGVKRWNNRELYQVRFESLEDSNQTFILLPQAEIHERMGLIAHPDRKIFWDKDVYVHIASIPKQESEGEFQQERFALDVGETVILSDSTKVLLERLVQIQDNPLYKDYDLAVKAKLRIYWQGIQFLAEPLLLIQGDRAISEPYLIPPIQTQFQFLGVDTEIKKVVFQRTSLLAPPDYIIIKAIEKPFIGILWLGTIFLVVGVTFSTIRRFSQKG